MKIFRPIITSDLVDAFEMKLRDGLNPEYLLGKLVGALLSGEQQEIPDVEEITGFEGTMEALNNLSIK